MVLSRAQKKKALAWFTAKNGDRGCPVCGHSSWKVETDASLGGLGAGAVHVVAVICLKCGHILLFNIGIAIDELEE